MGIVDETLKVFKKGEEGCNHNWIYDEKSKMCMTTPITNISMRICNICGRVEEAKVNFLSKQNEGFKGIYNKFHKQGRS